MKDDGLSEMDIVEAIINAPAIYKKIRSRHPFHPEKRNTCILFKV